MLDNHLCFQTAYSSRPLGYYPLQNINLQSAFCAVLGSSTDLTGFLRVRSKGALWPLYLNQSILS